VTAEITWKKKIMFNGKPNDPRRSEIVKELSRPSSRENRTERLQRFENYLESRGCPVRLVCRTRDEDIRWLG